MNYNSDSNIIYHYTSFDKFKCILKYGTLRFKESTQSNDMLDTIGLVNALKAMPDFKSPTEMSEALNFIIGYYKSGVYRQSSTSMVACFTTIPDSRMLWDAYTMNRPSNIECPYGEAKYCYNSQLKYNGACIAFRKDKLREIIRGAEGISCEKSFLEPIRYGEDRIKITLNELLKEAIASCVKLIKDEDQTQYIIPPIPIPFTKGKVAEVKKSIVYPSLSFIGKIDERSPFFKHEFWSEEKEIRASLYVRNGNIDRYKNIREQDGAKYCDIDITLDCIDHVILGPEFDDESIYDVKNQKDVKLDFNALITQNSVGTGVIRSK